MSGYNPSDRPTRPLEKAMQSASRIAAFALAFVALASASARHEEKKGEVLLTPAEIKWQQGPAALPKGAKMALLEGDPAKEGPFVMRLKLPDGFRVAPHTHRMDKRVTVISGTLYLGMGGKFDEKACKALPAGSYTR